MLGYFVRANMRLWRWAYRSGGVDEEKRREVEVVKG